jgi:uncharacterized protein (TIGR02266 family)
MSDASSSLERRRAVRVAVVIPIEIRDARGFTLHSSSDLSVGGVYFDRAIPHQVGTRVELSFNLPGDERTIVCAGEVANVPDAHQYGMGIRFVDLSAEHEAMLFEFIGGKE